MKAPIRKCCGKSHWESDWECPNKNGDGKKDFLVIPVAAPVVVPGQPVTPVAKTHSTAPRGRKAQPLVFDPEFDRPDSTATDLSKRQMRSRRRKPDEHREYMKNYMREYRKRKITERHAREEEEAKKGLTNTVNQSNSKSKE